MTETGIIYKSQRELQQNYRFRKVSNKPLGVFQPTNGNQTIILSSDLIINEET